MHGMYLVFTTARDHLINTRPVQRDFPSPTLPHAFADVKRGAAAQAAEALEARPSQPTGNGAVGFDVQVTGRMARSYPLSAVVGQEDIKEARPAASLHPYGNMARSSCLHHVL